MIKIGDRIDNKYRLVSRIAEGGMSEIYEAVSLKNKKEKFAIKFMLESLLDKEENIKRFNHEKDIISNLSHPNIVKIIDSGIFDNRPYIVLEYIKSQTIAEKLSLGYKFTILETLNIMVQLCDALKYLHNHGIIHRDIKPENIYCDINNIVKLSDFGIATDLSNITPDDRKVMGTAQYLDPEIVKGGSPNKQSDIYSLGITFYELLLGEIPFNGEDAIDVAISQIEKEVPSPSSINPNLGQDFDSIILRSTSKDKSLRYTNIEEMKEDILPLLKNKEKYNTKKSLFDRIFGFRRK